MQNLVAVSNSVYAHVGDTIFFWGGDAGTPPPCDVGVTDSPETRFSPRLLPYRIWSLYVKPCGRM